MNKRQLILASRSPQRKKILSTLDVGFEIMPADVDEQSYANGDLKERARELAMMKAESVCSDCPHAIIIGADTYAQLDDKALEKPKDITEAKEMLYAQSGKTVVGYTGFAYLDRMTENNINKVAEFEFRFRELSPAEIDYYVEQNPVTTWSAAFSPAYPEGAALIESMKGSFTAFAYGLPMEWVVDGLKESGVIPA